MRLTRILPEIDETPDVRSATQRRNERAQPHARAERDERRTPPVHDLVVDFWMAA